MISIEQEACRVFDCRQKQLMEFSFIDPFNTQNTLEGLKCTKRGQWEGSIILSKINGTKVKFQPIWGVPNLKYPYKNEAHDYLDDKIFFGAKKFYLANKWNGTNILLFKYLDANGKEFITAKTKGHYSISDSKFGRFLTHTKIVLEKKPELMDLVKKDGIQSVSFELCGTKEPHLVKYDFDLDLKPLFYTNYDADIAPVILEETLFDYKWSEMVKICKQFQQTSLERNDAFRKEHNLRIRYEYDHFATEGHVLYVIKENGFVHHRNLYKVKPKDIEEVHWQAFDDKMKSLVEDVMLKMKQREMEFNVINLQGELDMGPKQWAKFGNQVLKYIKEKDLKRKFEFPEDDSNKSAKLEEEKIVEEVNNDE